MKLKELIMRYLSAIQDIEQFHAAGFDIAVKTMSMENELLRLHELIAYEIETLYNMSSVYDTLKIIFSNLDKACGWGSGYAIPFMARELENLLLCEEAKLFLRGEICRLKTMYGTIINKQALKAQKKGDIK